MRALQTLLAEIVDYAGLFPPAALDMPQAARNYATYLAGPERWMLGRFVIPASRLGELAEARGASARHAVTECWRLSVLLGADRVGDLARVAELARGPDAALATVDSYELRAADPGDLGQVAADLANAPPVASPATPDSARPRAFVELPPGADADAFAGAAAATGLGLKLRTGGVTPDAFPPPEAVLRFLVACARHGVPYKLTAGLHHPLRGEHPLTYEPDCAAGTMYGFLGAFAAAAMLAAGHDAAAVAPLLEERDAASLTFDAAGPGDAGALCWRGLRADRADLGVDRRRLVSFGSCSFEEPVADLRALGLLPPPPVPGGATPPPSPSTT